MLTLVLGCLLSAFAVSFIATGAMRWFAPKWGLIDNPGSRKVHVTPTPMGGGIGIWLGTVLPLLAVTVLADAPAPDWIPEALRNHLPGVLDSRWDLWSLVGAASVLAAIGLIDDFVGLPWKPRLLIQLLVAVFLVYGSGVQGTLFLGRPWVGQVLTIGWILVLVNALNFLDNMDGLTGGIAAIAAVMFAFVMLFGTGEPRWFVAGTLLILAGATIGFLCHNWPPASIFMGDSGSYFLGCLLACLTVRGTFYDETVTGRHVMLTPLLILAIPLFDFASVMIIRLREGRSPFHADKSHFSHRLVELGLSKPNAVLTIHLATAITGLAALLLYRVPDWTGAVIILAIVTGVLAIVTILETAARRDR